MTRLLRQFLTLFATSLCLCFFSFAIKAQQVSKIEYYIDADPGFGRGVNVPFKSELDVSTSFPVDINTFSFGFHNLFVRSFIKPYQEKLNDNTTITRGGWSLTGTRTFYKENLSSDISVIPNIIKGEYFIDTDPGIGSGTNIPLTPGTDLNKVSFAFDITSLEHGFHTLQVRFKDKNGKWSLTPARSFFKENLIPGSTLLSKVVKGEYFIDTDPGFGKGTNIPVSPSAEPGQISLAIDITPFPTGFHNIYARFKDDNGSWSQTSLRTFYKENLNPNSTGPEKIVKGEYFLDSDPGFGKGTAIAVTAGTDVNNIAFLADISGSDEGFHQLHIRFKDAKGNWGLTAGRSFYKNTLPVSDTLSEISRVEYFIDKDPGFGKGKRIAITSGTDIKNIAFEIEDNTLSLGDHLIFIRAQDENDNWSIAHSNTFRIEPPTGLFVTIGQINKILCTGSSVSVPFTVNGNFSADNIFTAQLSDINGSFSSPRVIGTLSGTKSGTIEAVVPQVTPGSAYRIRIIASNPERTSASNNTDLTIRATPPAFTITGDTLVCFGSKQYALNNYATDVEKYVWSLSGGGALSADQNLASVNWNAEGSFVLKVKYTGVCAADDSVKTLKVKVINSPLTGNFQNLLPANGKTDVNLPLTFSWSAVKDASLYDLYIWPENETRPAIPVIKDIASTSYTSNDPFVIADEKVYKWQVVARRACYELAGPVSTFDTKQILAAEQTIDFPVIPDQYPNGTLVVGATASSGLPVTYTITTQPSSGVARLSGDTITFTGSVGKVKVKAFQAGNDFFKPAQAERIFDVIKRNQEISFEPIPPKTFGDAPFNPDATASSGLPVAFRIISGPATLNGTLVTLTAAGTVTIEATQSGNNIYSPAAAIRQSFIVSAGHPDLAVKNVTSGKSSAGPNEVVNVSWDVYNDGTAPSPADWTERIYIQSPSGENRTQIRQVTVFNNSTLATGKHISRSDTVTIPAELNVGNQAVFVVELIAGSSVQEAPGTQENNTGIQQTAWTIKKVLTLSLSSSQITEGSSNDISATVNRTGSLANALTVSVSLNNASRFSFPASVIIPAGQAGVSFTIEAPDNSTAESTATSELKVSASGFQGASGEITVFDNDLASLSVTNLPASALEGQTVTFKVQTSLAPSSPLTVYFQSANPVRFPVPATVIIPAGALSIDVPVILAQDDIPEIDLAVTFTAGAANHEPVTKTILVKDDDLPNLELVIQTNTISESAGLHATQATLRRTSTGKSFAFTANLSASIPNTLVLPETISLAAGENEKTFTIGVIDNNIADGQRKVTLTASMFVSSCGCNTPPASSGSVSADITINDNDGPSLQLTVTQQTFPEGLPNAGLLRITRNTPTTNALSVTLSSSDLSEATVPQTAVIPIGKTFIDIPVTTLNDGVTDGNQQVYFTVSASGFSSGSIWVMVTDLNKPDFEIPLVQLSSNSVQTGTLFNYQVSIKNSGSSKAPSGILVRGYLSKDDVIDNSDILVSENLLMEAIDAGQTKILINAAKSPDLSGSFKLLFWVNPDAAQNEILLTNNVSKAIDFTIEPGFLAKASAAATFVQKGTNIPITGSASKADGSPAPNSEVEVYVIVNGIRRNIKAVTDGSGKFTVQFTPLAGEAGHYILGASFPGMNQTTEQDAFDILGVSINDNVIPKFQVILNEPLTGSLKIQNLSNKSLTNFTLDPVTLPDGLTMEFATLASLAGNASVNLSYTIKGSELSNGNNYLEAGLQAKSDEGLNQNSKIYYYCQAANGYLVSNVSSIQASVSQSSGERKVEFLLVNKGKGATGEISVNLPAVNWMKSITPKTISSLSLGDTTVVTLSFLALDEVPFDFPVTGNIGINAANGNSFTIPFIFEKVAEASGTALITVSDQFTYYSEGAPKVQDAKVTIKNYFTGEVYAEGTTNADGVFEAKDIPEGTHRITVEKEHHQTYNNVLEINPGRTVEQDVFLNYQAITFNWTVVPTAIQDEYEVVLESKFETNVPIPVVTIEMPKTMPQLAEGQEYPFNITLTNHGLITAEQVTLMLPTTDPQYEFVTNYVTADLLAQQSIQVPAVMRRKNGLTGGRTMATAEDLPCSDYVVVMYTYKCNLATGLWEQNPATFTYQGRSCPGNGGEIPTPWWTGSSATGYPIGVPPCFIGCDGPSSGGASNIPTVEAAKTSCVACIADIAGAVLGCIPGADLPSLLVCVGGVALDGANHKKGAGLADCALEGVIGKIGGLVPGGAQLLCIRGILKAIETCSNTQVAGGGRLNGMQSALRTSEDLPSAALTEISGNLKVVLKGYTSFSAWMSEYFGDMITEEGLTVLFPLVKKYLNDLTPIPVNVQNDILTAMEGYEIEQTTLSAFFVRWNKSLEALSKGVQAPNSEYPNIINWNLVDNYVDSLINAHNYSVEKEYQTIDDMHSKSIAALNEIIDGQNEGVCASVVVQFNQKVTMTREAFEGTLEISNGHPTDAMKTISVNLMITDEEGTPSNGLFEIQTKSLTNLSDVTGTGEIGAQEKGSVKFLFIPEIGAAPQAPKLYKFGGSITYWDPYAEKVITLPLSAVSITVNPSPNLMLHYFMQRNILGDDALTSPEIEPTIPAELAVMVENKGYGPAVNMTISSAQPKIVDNEKGLAINFSLIGSNFQGQAKQLGITNINFGTIPGLQTRIGQWYFTSSLLGKFVSYDAKVVHSNSFGNPELSLIQGVKLHELTKSIQLYGGLKDGINDFLVNDVFDIADRPDIIYFSQGNRTAKVNAAASGSFSAPVSPPSFTNTLTVTPADTGFNYIKLDDPGNRLYELVSVTRGDGQAIPLDNAWLTFVTLPVSRSPVYENKFHFVDHFGSKGATNYTVIWKPVNTDVPRIDSIAGAPAEVVSEQVKHLKVYFNKGIDASTFTYKDLNLTLQGGANIINSSVIITQLDSATFDVDLSAVTTGNGFFNFTAQAAEITDIYGTSGLSGKQVTWSQFLNTPIVQAFEGLPADRFAQSYSSVGIYFNLPIEVATVTPARFTIYKDKVLQSGSLKIDSVSSDHRLFSLSGLDKILTQSGVYELRVDMLNISSETKVKGKQVQSVFLTVDNTGPTLTRIEKSDEGAIDPLHVAFIKLRFNEGVSGLNTSAFSLTRNGEAIPIRFTQLAFVDSRNWVAGNFGMQTYPDGDYVFSVNLENVVDSSGNIGSGTKQLSWKVNHQSTITISNVTISPDLGFSSTDGYTSGQSLTVGYRLNENASQVTISQIDPSGEVVLSNTSAVAAGNRTAAINISGGGELKIRITATAAVGGAVMAEKALYIDQLPLLAYWKLAPGQILKTQISSIPLAFSSKLLNTAKLLEGIQLRKDGVLIPSSGLGFETVNDSLYKIKGINNISNTAGTYQITFNIQNVSKYSSGKTNPGNVSVSWTVESANKAPLANAGTDISVTKTGTIKLNGTASSDPDSDALTYSWVAPEGIILSDTTAVSPSFTMTEADRGKTYSFMLIVSDGTLFSTDVVVVKFVSGEVTFSGLQDAYCHNSSSQKLTGIPSGGVFSGPGVVGNIFNPSLAGTGTHIISYKLSGQTATRSTTVNAIPGLGKDSTIAIKCANEKVDLTVLFSNMDFTKVWNTDKPEEAGAGIYKLVATNPAGCTDTLIVTVKQKIAIWKGQTSSNWSNPKNWDIMQIPDQETTVIFPANAPRCDLISTASIASIRMEKGSELTLSATAKLVVLGGCDPETVTDISGTIRNKGGIFENHAAWNSSSDGKYAGSGNGVSGHYGPSVATFTNRGEYNTSSGHKDVFKGPGTAGGTQEITGSRRPHFFDADFVNGTGSLIKITNTEGIVIAGNLNFENGITSTLRNLTEKGSVLFEESAGYSNSNKDSQHVNGYVTKVGNQPFTFPVGSGTDSRPVKISAPEPATAKISMAWIPGDPSETQDPSDASPFHPVTDFLAPLSSVSKVGQWDWISITDQTNPITVTVSIPDVSGFAAAENLRLAGWDGKQWIDLSGQKSASSVTENSMLTGTIPVGKVITALGIGQTEAPTASIRINAGGKEFDASANRHFIADRYYGGTDRVVAIPEWDIKNTEDDELYRAERSSTAFNYTIPVRNGKVRVVLHFAELFWGIRGRGGAEGLRKRLFNVDIEEQRFLSNYDIYSETGGSLRAVRKTFTVEVKDGFVNIDFSKGNADLPTICAIEVIPVEQELLSPIEDAYIRNGESKLENFGLYTTLETKRSEFTDFNRRTYLKFSLADVSKIGSARIRLYGQNIQNDNMITIAARSLANDSWTETGINWENAPSVPGHLMDTVRISSTLQYYEMDVTEFVLSEMKGDKMASFIIYNVQNDRAVFHSRENEEFPPQLIIENVEEHDHSNIRQGITETVEEAPSNTTSYVYPNPVKNTFQVKLSSRHKGNVSLRLMSSPGNTIISRKVPQSATSNTLKFDTSSLHLNAGLYLLEIQSSAYSEVIKLAVE